MNQPQFSFRYQPEKSGKNAVQPGKYQEKDAVVVDTINQFGKRGGELGEILLLLVESVKELYPNLSAEQQTAIQEQLRKAAKEHGMREFLGRSRDGILDRIQDWGNETPKIRQIWTNFADFIYASSSPCILFIRSCTLGI